jgi:Protein of unknown function (DUF3396)
MTLSFFAELDAVRIDRTRGKQTRTIGRVVFSMMFYMLRSTDPALLDQMKAARQYCRCIISLDHYRWCEAEGETGRLYDLRNPVEAAAAEEMTERQREKTVHHYGLYDFVHTEGEVPGHAIQSSWDLTYDRFGAQSSFQLNIPLPWFEAKETPGLPQQIFADLVGILRPLHAQGGLSMATARDPVWMQDGAEDLYPLLHKFPGLMSGWAFDSMAWLGSHMQTINWLNAVHDDLLQVCGGRQAVLDQLVLPGFDITAYPDGMIIQAGPTPQLGNRETGEKILHYGQLARALKPARVPPTRPGQLIQHAYQIPGTWEMGDDRLMAQAQDAYLTRFDDM